MGQLRRAQGIVAFRKKYDELALEATCKRAIDFDCYKYRFIENTLKSGVYANRLETKSADRGANPYLRQQELF